MKKSKSEWNGWVAIDPAGHKLHFTQHALALAYVVGRIDRNRRLVEIGEDLARRFRAAAPVGEPR